MAIRKRPHNVYIEDVLWDDAAAEAKHRRTSTAIIINMALRAWLERAKAEKKETP